jgi:thiol-disulfide isomerase/thioredoxin
MKNIENMGWTKFDGSKETIASMKGKVIILDFWATYCPPCLDEIPHLVEIQNKYGAQGLQVVGLHTGGAEDRPKVPQFVEKLKMNYVLAYPEEELTNTLFQNDDRIPQTFVFDRNGKLVKKIIGFDAGIKKELDEAIKEALNTN